MHPYLARAFQWYKSATLEKCGGLGDLIVIKQNKLNQMETKQNNLPS
jgi:hypothetical protein